MNVLPTDIDANIKTADLSLPDFLQQASVVPGKIGVFESVKGLDFNEYFRLQGPLLLLLEKGSCSLEVNMNRYELREGGVFIAFPGQVLRTLRASKDAKPLCIACSTDMMNDMMTQIKDSMQLLLLARQTPYQQREKEDFRQIVASFRYLQQKIRSTRKSHFHYQVVMNLFVSITYECASFLMEKSILPQSSNRKEALFNTFLRNVEKKHRQEHSVKYYADEMFVTPKYLSSVIDEMSGKGAKQWIDDYVALDAKVLLQSTQKDIQEISDLLNFPDVSFFGKFFKRMTGMSPKAFRQKKF